jgi:glycosyltransferase involved in cell wall biosynthesis
MNAPLVSVGIPVYNGERYLARAIDSVLAQSYRDFELLIVDNASDDSTGEIAASYASRDGRVKYLSNTVNLGAAPNFNRAFAESHGKYFAWLSSDDYWEAEFLEQCLTPLEADPACVLALPKIRVVDEVDKEVELVDDLDAVDARCPADRYGSVIFARNNSFYIFGLIRSSALRMTKLIVPQAHGDTILLARLSLLGPFAKVYEHLFVSRRHAAQSNKVFLDPTQPMGFDFARYSRWFAAPGASRSVECPYWWSLWEFYKASTGVRIGLRSRMKCWALLLRLARYYRRGLIADARRLASRLVAVDRSSKQDV